MDGSCSIGRRSSRALILLAIAVTLIVDGEFLSIARAYDEGKIHIVYLGERQHNDPKLVTDSHHRMLKSILGSKEAARRAMVYSYRHGFSGFAAMLTDSQAKKISEHPDVIHVVPNRDFKLQTTRTWDYIGLLPSTPKGLLNVTNMGSEVIIGVIDSGVWPESEAFDDTGYGPIPERWKGRCVSGMGFLADVNCNKKLIGAQYFMDGYLKSSDGKDLNKTDSPDLVSPRDLIGHGTHVSSTAVGSPVPNVSYAGLGGGTVRGGAPRARVAMYKACWGMEGKCKSPDIVKSIDHAIHDGVDVLSMSVGSGVPLDSEVDEHDFAIAAFHAVQNGIPVVVAGGNDGPDTSTVTNVAPWMITVAATSLDRSFATQIDLGNNLTIVGEGFYAGPEIGFTGLVSSDAKSADMTGNVLLLFPAINGQVIQIAQGLKQAGGVGLILARNPTDLDEGCPTDFPCINVDYELATDILKYIQSTSSPKIKISPSKTLIGQTVATKVARFSGRGPNSLSPAILKPDIAAPGVNILAATPATSDGKFEFKSGTSMATPVISGIVALLKSLHPDWSPAAIKSALVTTARRTDPSGEAIIAEGLPRKLADPFDYGGGLVNPEKAAEPGLVYDMAVDDYIHYLCSAGYNDSSITKLLNKTTTCAIPKPSMLDVNLPSITIPDLKDEVTITRTVTNVGPVDSVYRAKIEPPFGINLVVKPETLFFNSTSKKATFTVGVSTTHKQNTIYYFGSLTWTDGVHNVTIPVSIRTRMLKYFN